MLASYLWLVWGVYRLGRVAFTPLVGALAALLLLTRFDFAFLAARGYIDVPYMALVVWAVVLEASRPRRGRPVFVLLGARRAAAAGGVAARRPVLPVDEPGGDLAASARATPRWPRRRRVIWAAVDFAVTGDPLFSLHYTSASAEDLGRQRTLSEIPSALPEFFSSLVKLPVLLAALLGIGVALCGGAAAGGHAARAAAQRHRHVRADRRRRRCR